MVCVHSVFTFCLYDFLYSYTKCVLCFVYIPFSPTLYVFNWFVQSVGESHDHPAKKTATGLFCILSGALTQTFVGNLVWWIWIPKPYFMIFWNWFIWDPIILHLWIDTPALGERLEIFTYCCCRLLIILLFGAYIACCQNPLSDSSPVQY